MRALDMHVDEDVFVAAGDHVDVLLTTKQGQTSTVIENVEVAAANQSTSRGDILGVSLRCTEGNDCR